MGTSHRHTPTVVGEPNWGNASAAVTNIAKAEGKLNELGKEQENDKPKKTAAQIAKRQQQLNSQKQRNYHKAVHYLVKAAGGRSKVSSGASRAIGHAGINIAIGFVSTVSDIINNGLTDWLGRRGVISLEGESCQNVLDLIRNYIEDDVAGLDNTAANEALEYVLDELGQKIGEDLSSFENAMNTLMTSNDIKDLLDKFFGMYIFSHLSQNFKEKLEYEKGTQVMNDTMNEIKELIMDDIQRCSSGKDALCIDWSAEEGKAFVKEEFDRIIYILSGDED